MVVKYVFSSPFSQTYISHMLHKETKLYSSINLLEVILFLGKNHTEYVGSYSFSQKHSIQGPKRSRENKTQSSSYL